MSCWVVPSVAAEMWGMAVDRVLAGIADGSVSSRTEGAFLLVDVTCGGEKIRRPEADVPFRKRADAPATFTVLTQAETEALARIPPAAPAEPSPFLPMTAAVSNPVDVSQWRRVRTETGRSRRRPAHVG